MRRYAFLTLLAAACAPSPPPACPRCYEIDEVLPYEPPRRVIILCDEPDAGPRAEPEDAGDDRKRTIY